jgi:hypothetical protein
MPKPNALTRKRLAQVTDIATAAEKRSMAAIVVVVAPNATTMSLENNPRGLHTVMCQGWLRLVKRCENPRHMIAWIRTVTPTKGEEAIPIWNSILWSADIDFATDALRRVFHGHASVTFAADTLCNVVHEHDGITFGWSENPRETAMAMVESLQADTKATRAWAKRHCIRRFQVGGRAALGLMPNHVARALPQAAPAPEDTPSATNLNMRK